VIKNLMVGVGALIVAVTMGAAAMSYTNNASATPTQPPTYGDYRRAVEQTRQCVKAAGVDVSEAAEVGDRMLRFTMTYRASAADEADAVYNRCRDEHLRTVERAWMEANAPSDETRASRRRDIAQCVRPTDPAFPASPSVDDIREELGKGMSEDCVRPIGNIGAF
jgi:hypothetical protein